MEQVLMQLNILVLGITKKYLVIILVFLGLNLKSQEITLDKNIIGGVAYNTLAENLFTPLSISYYYYNRFSPYLGYQLKFNMNNKQAISISAYYVQRGVRFNYIYDSPMYYINVDQKITPHYLSFPISYTYKFNDFYAGFGVEGSFLLIGYNSIYHYEKNDFSGTITEFNLKNWDYENLYQIGDVGYTFTAGYNFNRFSVELNYFHGFIPPPKFNIFPAPRFAFQYTYQQTFRLGVAYKLNQNREK